MARILPGSICHLNAARAALGIGAGSNDAPTEEWFDLSGQANHGTLTNFAYEAGNRPRTNVETDKAVWHDLSGNGNDGTLTGFTSWDGTTDGWTTDPALLFAGAQYVPLAANLGLASTKTLSFDVWFTTTYAGVGYPRLIVEKNPSSPYGEVSMFVAPTDRKSVV